MVVRPGNEASLFCPGTLPIYHAHMRKIPGSPHLVMGRIPEQGSLGTRLGTKLDLPTYIQWSWSCHCVRLLVKLKELKRGEDKNMALACLVSKQTKNWVVGLGTGLHEMCTCKYKDIIGTRMEGNFK